MQNYPYLGRNLFSYKYVQLSSFYATKQLDAFAFEGTYPMELWNEGKRKGTDALSF